MTPTELNEIINRHCKTLQQFVNEMSEFAKEPIHYNTIRKQTTGESGINSLSAAAYNLYDLYKKLEKDNNDLYKTLMTNLTK